jgi:4-amino-4-deoxy-L-arabinose transferase-like glycosyltransferase
MPHPEPFTNERSLLPGNVAPVPGFFTVDVESPRPTAPRPAWYLRHGDLLVFILALAGRLAWIVTRDETLAWIDEQQFIDIARHLSAGEGYVSDSFRANPILPAFVSVVFRVFGPSLLYPRIAQAILGALTCVLIARIGRRVGGERAGLVAGLLSALYLPHVYLSGVFYVDVVLTFLSAVLVLFLMRAGADGRLGDVVGAGVALGLVTLTRPLYLAYLPAPCLLWLWAGRRRPVRALVRCAVFTVCTILTILPWTLRNHAVYGRVVPVSTGFGTKLWEGNNPAARGDADDRDLRWTRGDWNARLAGLPAAEREALNRRYEQVSRDVQARRERGDDDYLAMDPILLPIALEYMRENPGHTAWLYGQKLLTLYSAFTRTWTENPDTSVRNQWVAALTFYPLLALAVVGAAMGIRRRAPLGAMLALVATVSLTYALLNTCTRFRLPLDPFFTVLAAFPLVWAWDRFGARRLGGASEASATTATTAHDATPPSPRLVATTRRLQTMVAALFFAAVAGGTLVRTIAHMYVPGQPDAQRWGMQDFRDGIYYPAVAFLEGRNPYDVPDYTARYPVARKFPLFTPTTLATYLPFALLPPNAAAITFLVVCLGLTAVLAALVLIAAGITPTAARVFAVAGCVVASHPGQMALFIGQGAIYYAIGLVLAFAFGGTRPVLAGIGLALVLMKPTVGIPAASLLAVRGDHRVLAIGVGLTAVLSFAVVTVLIGASGGVGAFLAAVADNYGRWGQDAAVKVTESVHRIDAFVLAGRSVGRPLTALEDLVITGAILGLAIWGLRRAVPVEDAARRPLSSSVMIATILLGFYHQAYDAVFLALPLAFAATGAWGAAVPARLGRGVLYVGAAVLAANYFATDSFIDQFAVSGTTWIVLTSLNAVAMTAVYASCLGAAVGARKADQAERRAAA